MSAQRLQALLGLALLALARGQATFGDTGPWKATYAAADPVAARDFAVKYLGAREIPQPHHGGNGTCALIKWVEFPQSQPPYQLHFVNAFDKRVGNLTLEGFARYIEALSGNISTSNYSQYMDNHVGLRVDSADPYLARLRADGVPFFTRKQSPHESGCDVFMLVPSNGLVVELKSSQCSNVTHVQGWDFCSASAATAREADAAVARHLPPRNPGAPSAVRETSMVPWKMTYAVTDPDAAADFCVAHLGARNMAQHVSNGTCATVRWVSFPNATGGVEYQLHFVHNPHKAAGGMPLRAFERYLVALHGDLRAADGPRGNGQYDQWMDNHVGLSVPSVAPYIAHFQRAGVPYFTRGQQGDIADVFVEIGASGIIFEFAHKGPDANATALTPWDMCAKPPQSAGAHKPPQSAGAQAARN
eukprot:g4642.t1